MIRARVLGNIMPDTPGARFLEQGCLNVDGNSRPLNARSMKDLSSAGSGKCCGSSCWRLDKSEPQQKPAKADDEKPGKQVENAHDENGEKSRQSVLGQSLT